MPCALIRLGIRSAQKRLYLNMGGRSLVVNDLKSRSRTGRSGLWDPSGWLVHKKDGTVSMTVWSRAASWPSFSRASLSSWLSAFRASALMFAQSTGCQGLFLQFQIQSQRQAFRALAVIRVHLIGYMVCRVPGTLKYSTRLRSN